MANPAAGAEICRVGLGFGEPIPETEEGTYFPAFIPALLDFTRTLVREAEGVFMSANGVDHRVGCFHQDGFPFWVCLFEP